MSIKESSIEEQLTKLKMNPRWWEANKHQYTLEDWWRFCADESTMTLGEVAALIQSERRKAAIEELGRMKRRAEQFQDMAHRKVMATTLINIVDRIDELESNSFSAQIVESNKKIRKDFRELESNTEKEK